MTLQYLQKMEKSTFEIIKTIELFSKVSGLKFNMQKMRVSG